MFYQNVFKNTESQWISPYINNPKYSECFCVYVPMQGSPTALAGQHHQPWVIAHLYDRRKDTLLRHAEYLMSQMVLRRLYTQLPFHSFGFLKNGMSTHDSEITFLKK